MNIEYNTKILTNRRKEEKEYLATAVDDGAGAGAISAAITAIGTDTRIGTEESGIELRRA